MPATPADAERLARELYGMDATATALPGECDENFRLTASDGQEYALKIMRAGCDRAFLELQSRAFEKLSGLPVPRVSAIESPIAETADGRLVWLLDWLPGRLLADIKPRTPKILQDLGKLLGTIDARLEDFSHPAAHREFKWDIRRAGWIR